MHDIVLASVALFGVIIVATVGSRFMAREDDRAERIALGDSPAAWGQDTADVFMVR